ncbi:Rieske 2Fe-2S family protein [Microbulbifer donghaiensis]|uniref:Rieske 2Fe-2S family protein n=1 Tax=Microbulbifer donghaiensis TaxID=494016 RepID=A0A1M5FJI8_9GAMM|nr:aromatic ring-hydroxylating dioxygenase subunit alpha [Microbulbifer donghaiensis]SHF91614.1 Rieske 2Fe-2S family protein [Microbulbifer donghaiensis]
MKKILATDREDNLELMQAQIALQRRDPDAAPLRYFYHSPFVYQRELETIIFRSWHFAGHVSQLAQAGDFFLFEIAGESVILVRGDDGRIRGLINSCRHRGSRVCEAASGNRKTFVCPYHGWVYDREGSLRAARAMECLDGFNTENFSLKPVRVAIRYGLIFVNFESDAADFEASMALLDRQMSPYHLDTAKIAHRQSYPVDANWKIALGNYLECYHCLTAHRLYSRIHSFKSLEHEVADLNRDMWARSAAATGVADLEKSVYRIFREAPGFGACAYTSRYALFPGFKTGSVDGAPLAPLMGDFKGFDEGAGDFQFGPLAYMLNYPDHCVLFRYVPRAIDKTEMEIIWFVRGDAREGVDYQREELTRVWHETTLEDKRIMDANARGIRSHFYEPGPQHPQFEDTPKRFFDWYLYALAGDFGVLPPSPRAHRTSAVETTD